MMTISLIASITQIFAATGGPNYPGTAANINGPGTISWTGTGNIINTGDANYVTAVLTSPTTTSEYLQTTNYGFNIPTSATINGIQISIRRMSSSAGGSNSINDVDLYLLKAGTITGTNKAVVTDWPTSMTAVSYGGTGDLRGTTWTPAQINASNFGVSLSAISQSSSSSRTASVDYITVTVTYTPDTTPPTVST